jgi:hypothetical protein
LISYSAILEAGETCFAPRRISKFFTGLDNVWARERIKNRNPKKITGY